MIILPVLLLNDSGIAQLTELLGGVCVYVHGCCVADEPTCQKNSKNSTSPVI